MLVFAFVAELVIGLKFALGLRLALALALSLAVALIVGLMAHLPGGRDRRKFWWEIMWAKASSNARSRKKSKK